MFVEIKIESITLGLSEEGDNLHVKSDRENVILSNQSINSVTELIKYNFNVVINYYKETISKSKDSIDLEDIYEVGISIVLYYLYMYNLWRGMYKNQRNRDLKFNEKDLNHPSTFDIVFHYFKTKYPSNWEEKCAIILGMDSDKLTNLYKSREGFITNEDSIFHHKETKTQSSLKSLSLLCEY